MWYFLAVAVAWTYLQRVIQRVGQGTWEDLKAFILEEIVKVQDDWTGESGAERREAVRAAAVGWLVQKHNLNFVQRIVVSYVVTSTITAIVESFKETLGDDWLDTVKRSMEDVEQQQPWLGAGMEAGGA